MLDKSNEFINIEKGHDILSDNAFNYKVKKEDICLKLLSIFEHYDIDSSNELDTSELEILKKDLENANNDENKDVLSKKEALNFIEKIFPNQKINPIILFQFLNELQKNYINTIETTHDGIIDWAEQGNDGDCWLLSEVRALSQTDWGAQIIKESINYDSKNKTFTISLKGVDFTCIITLEELKKERKKSKRPKGDIDVILLEIATEKYFKQEIEAGRMKRNKKHILYGSDLMGKESMQYLLTGNKGHSFYFYNSIPSSKEVDKWSENIKNNPEKLEYYTENKDCYNNIYNIETKNAFMKKLAEKIKTVAVVCSFHEPYLFDNTETHSKTKKYDKFNNQINHAFSIKDIVTDENSNVIDIIINNPWNPNISIHKTLNEFIDQIEEICITDKDGNYDDLKEYSEPSWLWLD